MSIGLGLPVALWALAALALPLLLHLARREQQREQVFAALRWLAPRQRPRHRLRLREWPLLAVRLALLAALAVLLAQPWWRMDAGGRGWVLVHPARAPAPVPEGFEHRWLAPGFPSLDAPRPAPPADLASLLREADATLPPHQVLSVQVPAVLDGLDGAAVRLSRGLDWQVSDATAETTTDGATAPPLRLAAPEGDAQRWYRALHAAWQAGEPAPAPFATLAGDSVPAGDGVVLAWPGDRALTDAARAWVTNGGLLLLEAGAAPPAADAPVLARAADGEPLLRGAALGRGQWRQWTRPLTPEALPDLLDPGFPARLHEALRPAAAPARARADAVRPATGGPAPAPPPAPLDGPGAWLVLALFALERLLATRPGRGGAP